MPVNYPAASIASLLHIAVSSPRALLLCHLEELVCRSVNSQPISFRNCYLALNPQFVTVHLAF